MLHIPPCDLDKDVATTLRTWQRDVDGPVDDPHDYATRVREAARLYHSRSQLPAFTAVKATLAGMCPGAQRCMYCEDSAGEQVEHVQPKSLYPEAVFAWLNFLYACGGCNTPKNNEYAVLVDDVPLSVARKKGAPVVPPRMGPAALLDPRRDDLMAFLEIVLPGTFEDRPRLGLSASARARAVYTIETLGFNKREYLRNSRRRTYASLKSFLEQYIQRKSAGRRDDMARIEYEIRVAPHPAVWFEMRRLHDKVDELQLLFAQAPEALAWDWQPDVV